VLHLTTADINRIPIDISTVPSTEFYFREKLYASLGGLTDVINGNKRSV